MRPETMLSLLKRFTQDHGVIVSWKEASEEINSSGVTVTSGNGEIITAKVLLLKERFNALKSLEAVSGVSHDYTRYILTLPEIDIRKDVVITDNHGIKWKLGIVDWFDIGGVSVAKQAKLMEVA